MQCVEPVLESLPCLLHLVGRGVRRDAHRLAERDHAAAKGQAQARMVPGVEVDAAACDHGAGADRPARKLGEHDDAGPDDAGSLWNIGRHANDEARGQGVEHFAQRLGSSFAPRIALAGTRASQHPDAEVARGARIDLGRRMFGNEAGAVVDLADHERQHEMLAVPERGDERFVLVDIDIKIGRIERKARAAPQEPQIARHGKTERGQYGACPSELLEHEDVRPFPPKECQEPWPGSRRRCKCTMKYRI